MAETTMTHTEIVRMLSRALPRETRIESYWVAFRRCGAVRISVAGREMSMDVDRLAYYGSPATEAVLVITNGGTMTDGEDVEAIIERRIEELRPAHEEYVRLSRALLVLRPRTRTSDDGLDVVDALRKLGGPASPRDVAAHMGIDLVSAQNKLLYAMRSSDSVRRVGRGLYEYVG
jgi:hypothetical protein